MGQVDGLIVGGGDDISPTLYGGDVKITARLDLDRDALERQLVEQAITAGKPVLGICRGAQMLNIALGGTLHQDAYALYENSRYIRTILPRKIVDIKPQSLLARISGDAPMSVNALHTQSIDRLGEGLRAVAHDSSGMIQAIEREEEPFAIGVQWHPEHLFYARRQRALFRALAAAADAHRKSSEQVEVASQSSD